MRNRDICGRLLSAGRLQIKSTLRYHAWMALRLASAPHLEAAQFIDFLAFGRSREKTVSLMDQLLSRRSDEPLATRRLDGGSKELLTASIKMMPYGERGWITIREAAILFSPVDDEYAFREGDRGTRNLVSFVAEDTRLCRFAFIEGRLYFIRTPSNLPETRASTELQHRRRPWSEAIGWTIDQVLKEGIENYRKVAAKYRESSRFARPAYLGDFYREWLSGMSLWPKKIWNGQRKQTGGGTKRIGYSQLWRGSVTSDNRARTFNLLASRAENDGKNEDGAR